VKRILVETLLILGAFVAGYVPGQWLAQETRLSCDETKERLQSRLREVETDFQMVSLHAELGTILVEVEENNFGKARERSTRFFDRLRETIAGVQDPVCADKLRALLKHRDEVNADLVALSPAAAAKLRQLYSNYADGADVGASSK